MPTKSNQNSWPNNLSSAQEVPVVGVACSDVSDLRASDTPGENLEAVWSRTARLLLRYTGVSMYPTLREGDLLEVIPYGKLPVQVGDVVHCEPAGRDVPIIHRIIQVTPQGIRTRGDNNPAVDDWLLSTAELRGRVVAAWRGSRRRPIAGGRAGQLIASLLRVRLALDRGVARLGRPLYRALADRGWLARRLPPGWRPRPVAFQTTDGTRLRLVWGRRVVGHYDPDQRRWLIRRPYRLLVDEAGLPHPE